MKQIALLFFTFALVPPLLMAAEEKQATVSNGVREADLSTVTLTPEAERHLAIATEAVERKPVPETLLYGGELVLPDPVSATGQSVFSLLPQMAPADRLRLAEEQINADGILESAKVEVAAAQVVLDRASALLEQRVGSQRSVDDARARVDQAGAALVTAEAKRELLGPPVLAAKSPPLLWVKVPVYVGDLDAIEIAKDAVVGRLDGRADGAMRSAKPVEAPPSANPLASTVDIFFEVENPDQKLVPGQRVGVTVPLKTAEDYLVVPYAAVLYDINGGSWVYEAHGERTYSFRRVQISRVVGDRAVIESGPKEGSLVVTDGAAELFGTEFGVGK